MSIDIGTANRRFELACVKLATAYVVLLDCGELESKRLSDRVVEYRDARAAVNDALNAIAEGKE